MGTIESWAGFTEKPPWLHFPELALALMGIAGRVRFGETRPHTWGEALRAHNGELLSNLQRGALP